MLFALIPRDQGTRLGRVVSTLGLSALSLIPNTILITNLPKNLLNSINTIKIPSWIGWRSKYSPILPRNLFFPFKSQGATKIKKSLKNKRFSSKGRILKPMTLTMMKKRKKEDILPIGDVIYWWETSDSSINNDLYVVGVCFSLLQFRHSVGMQLQWRFSISAKRGTLYMLCEIGNLKIKRVNILFYIKRGNYELLQMLMCLINWNLKIIIFIC